MGDSSDQEKGISKAFNAESILRAVNKAMENMIESIQSPDKGLIGTWVSAAISRTKLIKAANNLAHLLGVPTEDKRTYTVLNEIAAKAAEQNIPGADRLRMLIDWNDAFWSKPEVKAADALEWHPIKSTQIIKQLAQQQPRP